MSENTERVTDRALCRVKQAEAREILKQLFIAQQKHKSVKKAYAKTLGALGVVITESAVYYTYRITAVDENTFRAEATALDADMGGDTWSIDETGEPQNIRDGCV